MARPPGTALLSSRVERVPRSRGSSLKRLKVQSVREVVDIIVIRIHFKKTRVFSWTIWVRSENPTAQESEIGKGHMYHESPRVVTLTILLGHVKEKVDQDRTVIALLSPGLRGAIATGPQRSLLIHFRIFNPPLRPRLACFRNAMISRSRTLSRCSV